MTNKPFFTGPFAPMCEAFIAQKQAVGYRYDGRARRLRQFDRFCEGRDILNYEITEELVAAYSVKRPNESDPSRRDRIYIVRTFAEFLSRQGIPSYVMAAPPRCGTPNLPYVFSRDEIRDVLSHADRMPPTNYSTIHLILPFLLRVLYGCGLRISEALALRRGDVDVDMGTLHIRHGKNDNERILPMSDSLLRACQQYLGKAHTDTADNMPLFYTKSRTAYTKDPISKGLRSLLWDVGVPYRGKDIGPHLHDLRHTFICHNIQNWAEAGIPIHTKLPILSKYAGHTSVDATQWYLRLTAEIYPHIRNICERELGGIYAVIPNLKGDDCDE